MIVRRVGCFMWYKLLFSGMIQLPPLSTFHHSKKTMVRSLCSPMKLSSCASRGMCVAPKSTPKIIESLHW